MGDALLILNAGSSSVKFSVFDCSGEPRQVLRGQVVGVLRSPAFEVFGPDGELVHGDAWPDGTRLSHAGAVAHLLEWLAASGLMSHELVGAGHRVVHGGDRFDRPVRIDDRVLQQLRDLIPLAPLHQPPAIDAIEAVAHALPDLPQFACFDTSFHRTQPAVAREIAIPREFTDGGLRRYGFHGLSYEYVAGVLPGLDPRGAAGRTIVAHLGAGASMCAMLAGRSVATTMGFTALDGLVMSTRCGSIDPGVLLFLLQHHGLSVDTLQRVLYERSGLLAVSEISGDMRTLVASDDPAARTAVDLFVYRAGREIGSLAAALGGLDTLVFTAGIGERSAPIRARVCEAAAWLGVALERTANESGGPRISPRDSRVAVWVVPTNEELMIARHALELLGRSHDPTPPRHPETP